LLRAAAQQAEREEPGRENGDRGWFGDELRGTVKIGDVGGSGEIYLEQLFCYRGAAVAEAFAVALVDEELIVVDRDDVTYPRTDPARRCSR